MALYEVEMVCNLIYICTMPIINYIHMHSNMGHTPPLPPPPLFPPPPLPPPTLFPTPPLPPPPLFPPPPLPPPPLFPPLPFPKPLLA